jgi:hypothetical protein
MKHYEMYYYSNHHSFVSLNGLLTRRFFAKDFDDAVAQANSWLSVKMAGETETKLLSVYLV